MYVPVYVEFKENFIFYFIAAVAVVFDHHYFSCNFHMQIASNLILNMFVLLLT